jgi:hypothetical protein
MNNKTKINKIKLKTLLKKFPILVVIQHNNFTVKDWFELKQQINQLSPQLSSNFLLNQRLEDSQPHLKILSIKNSLLKYVLLETLSTQGNSFDDNLVKTLCQGPNLLIGCQSVEQLKSLFKLVSTSTKYLFISCFYNNQLLTHLDLKVLLKTNSSIYQCFISCLDKKTELYNTLQTHLEFQPLQNVQTNLLAIFSTLKNFKRIEN